MKGPSRSETNDGASGWRGEQDNREEEEGSVSIWRARGQHSENRVVQAAGALESAVAGLPRRCTYDSVAELLADWLAGLACVQRLPLASFRL